MNSYGHHYEDTLRGLHGQNVSLKIVSDANSYFIRTILTHHNILGLFDDIVTNPATANEQGCVNDVSLCS